MEVHVERRGRAAELVGQAGERERCVGQDVRSSSTHRRAAAGHGREPPGDGVGEALVERLRRSRRRGPIETADRAHHAGRRHAAEKAVALDERCARPRACGRHGGGQAGGAATHHHDVVAQRAVCHPMPSRIVSTIRVTSPSVAAPSIQDTTRLFLIPQRLKNTPIPGRGSTEGAWYALTTRRPKSFSSATGKSMRSAQLKEKVSRVAVPGRSRSITESGRYFRNSIAAALESICPSRRASVIWRRKARVNPATSAVSDGLNRAKWKASTLPKVGPGSPLGRTSTETGTRKGTSGNPRCRQSSAMVLPTSARRQQISRVERTPSTPRSSPTKLACLKRARPGDVSPVPGDTGGTGVSVRM